MIVDIQADLRRYAMLIEPQLQANRRRLKLQPEPPPAVRVERAALFAEVLSEGYTDLTKVLAERLIELARSGEHLIAEFFDAGGHERAVYRPLTVYAWLQSFGRLYESLPAGEFGRWEEGTRGWADLLEADLGRTAWPTELPALSGDRWAEMAWNALALHVAGKVFVRDVWTDLANDAFGRIGRAQRENGAFLAATPSDQPETMWYHELQILHAAASYAVQAEDRNIAAAVSRATVFHQNETQPDHATAQPWALWAFIWNADTRMVADQLLHTVQTQHPDRADGVSLMLLADSLYSLRLFL
jgi:hypothetical protein